MAGEMLALRPYQREAIDATTKSWRSGTARPAIVLPTGAGKTVVFSHMIKEFIARNPGKRALVLAHREELVDQAYDKLRTVAPSMRSGVVMADRNQTLADAIVGCVPTLANERRLRQLANVGLVVVDECHHATAASYRRILEFCGSMRETGATPTVGVTATLVRGDGGALGDVWQEVPYELGIDEMIRDGYLVRPRGRRIKVDDLQLKGMRVRGGDYSDSEMGERIENSMAPSAIAKAYRKHAAELQGIVFAPTVRSAELIAAEMVGVGVSTALVHGAMAKAERRRTLDDFRAGRVQVLCNCMVLTEGTDLPMAQVAVIARPTLNPGLYIQMVGRVLRLHPGKDFALVLDLVGVSQRHALHSPVELFGDSAEDRLDPETGEIVEVKQGESEGDGSGVLKDIGHADGPLSSVEVDLFHGSASMWQRTRLGIWFLSAGDRLIAIVPSPDPGQHDVVAMHKTRVGESRWVVRGVADLSYAMSWAESDVTPMEMSIVKRDSGWRLRTPTVKQVQYARRLGVEVRPDMSSGEVSREIARVQANERIDTRLPAYARVLVSAGR